MAGDCYLRPSTFGGLPTNKYPSYSPQAVVPKQDLLVRVSLPTLVEVVLSSGRGLQTFSFSGLRAKTMWGRVRATPWVRR